MRLTLYPDGRVTRPGMETPKGTELVKRKGNTLVIKVPASSHWVGLNVPRQYDPAHFIVYDIVDGRMQNDILYLNVTETIRFPIRKEK